MLQNIKEFVMKNKKWIILIICIIAVLVLGKTVLGQDITKLDTIGYKLVTEHIKPEIGANLAKGITHLGSATGLIILTVLCLVVIKEKKIGLAIALNLMLECILNISLKLILQRPRPIDHRLIEETGYSFPSGHSMASMAFYGFLIYLIYKNVKNKYIKRISIIALSILIVLIGASRIYLGVHYTSDVIAGFLIAIAYLILYTNLIKKFIFSSKEEKHE